MSLKTDDRAANRPLYMRKSDFSALRMRFPSENQRSTTGEALCSGVCVSVVGSIIMFVEWWVVLGYKQNKKTKVGGR